MGRDFVWMVGTADEFDAERVAVRFRVLEGGFEVLGCSVVGWSFVYYQRLEYQGNYEGEAVPSQISLIRAIDERAHRVLPVP